MEERIIKGMLEVFNVKEEDVKVVRRLMGGMSNYTYVVDVLGVHYTYRIPGNRAETFVDRVEEQDNINRISPLDLNNHTIYLNTETGVKIAYYLEGTPLSEVGPSHYLPEVAVLLKRLHNCKQRASKDYLPLDRLSKYEGAVIVEGGSHCDKYYALKDEFLKHYETIKDIELVFCHNDAQTSNFLIGEKNYLLDWEFAANNDPLYDIACFGNVDFNMALALLPVYLGRKPSHEEVGRVHLWRAFQCLQWHNVAQFKELIGLSKELMVDFKKISEMYLVKAEDLLNKFNNL